ncbi:MAG: UvrD-helicase domain-containing protein, partial [Acidobacteria bacterium]|nr:UvrD-helicase domain-containing protein [Acidobacteriota bacterium]
IEHLRPAFDVLCQYPDVQFPAGDAAMPDPNAAWGGLDRFWDALTRLLPNTIAEETTCPIQQKAREFSPALRSADRGRLPVLVRLLKQWEKSFQPKQKWWASKPVALQAGQLVEQFQNQLVTPFLEAWRHYVYRLVVTLGLLARDYAADERRMRGELNFEDLLQLTARVLRTNTDVRYALQRKYPRIFVDEFQDTDPIQTEIVFLLAAESVAGTDWTALPLRPGALFLVGDPKQSIFRFRRADIEIYEQAKGRIRQSGGQVLELTTCYRAVPALSGWANRAFTTLFPVTASPQQPAYRELDGVNVPWGGPVGVFQLRIPGGVNRREVPAVDARSIAACIKAEQTAGRRRWADFMVITRRKRNLALYASELERAGVPYEVTGSESLAGSSSVLALTSLLYALYNPDDSVALVGVLRGPLFGLDDESLFDFRRAGGRFLLTVPDERVDRGPVGDAIATLSEMFRWTRLLPVGAAIDRILEATGLLARAAAESAGGAEAGALVFAIDCLRAAAESGASLAQAVDELALWASSGEADPPTLEPGRLDVVRVMNLHKAKGLEASIVFLADPLAGVEPRAQVHIVRAGNQAVGHLQVRRPKGPFGGEVVAEPENWAGYEAAELPYVTAEETRLLYVACTRPMQMLVVSRWDKADRLSVRPWESGLSLFLNGAPEVPIPTVQPALATQRVPIDADAWRAATAARAEIQTAVVQPSWTVEAVTSSVGATTRHAAAADGAHGPAWGRLVHALLGYAAAHPNCQRGELEACGAWPARLDAECEPFLREAVETVSAVMSSAFWERARNADRRLVEVPFMAAVPGVEPPMYQTGVIDLALRFPSGWEIIDYKTEAAELADLAAYQPMIRQQSERRYRHQDTQAGHYPAISNQPEYWAPVR